MKSPERHSSEVVIAKEIPEDAQGIHDVYYKSWLATYPNSEVGITEEDVHAMFSLPPGSRARTEPVGNAVIERSQRLVAKIDGLVVGVCGVNVRKGYNQLQTIYVLPDYFDKGVGRALWEAQKDFFDPSKPTIVQVATYNSRAISFYERLGFKDTGRRLTEERLRMPISKVLIPEMEMEMPPTS